MSQINGQFNIQITLICFSGCRNITDVGLTLIVSLRRLECLKINSLKNVTDAIFYGSVTTLKRLECKNCPKMGNSGLFNLFTRCQSLSFVDLNHCRKVDYHLIEVAAKITRNRTNNVICKMNLDYTLRLGYWGLKEQGKSPFLKVSFDNVVPHV